MFNVHDDLEAKFKNIPYVNLPIDYTLVQVQNNMCIMQLEHDNNIVRK